MTEPTALVHLVKVYYSDQDPELVDDPQYWLITWHLNEFNNLNFEVTDPTRGNEGDEPEDIAGGGLLVKLISSLGRWNHEGQSRSGI